jgi:hypothetical protein
MNSCAAKPVSFVSLVTVIFSLRHPDEPSGEDELRKSPPSEDKEVPARNGNKRTQVTECVEKSSLELRKSPPCEEEEISARNRAEEGGGQNPSLATTSDQHRCKKQVTRFLYEGGGGVECHLTPGNSLQGPSGRPETAEAPPTAVEVGTPTMMICGRWESSVAAQEAAEVS